VKQGVPEFDGNKQEIYMKSFFEEVYAVVERIPYGKVASYGQIAWILDRHRSARIVGYAMRRCPEGLPWYRVVKADGSPASGVPAELCRDLLSGEGVIFLPDGRVDMEACRWNIE